MQTTVKSAHCADAAAIHAWAQGVIAVRRR
jgi:hypothetical protein